MKYYSYHDIDGAYTYSEQDIIDVYWNYWIGEMIKVGKILECTRQNCINDWIVTHWAFELGEEDD